MPDESDAVRDRNTVQRGASEKRIWLDAYDAVRDGHACQAATRGEDHFPDD